MTRRFKPLALAVIGAALCAVGSMPPANAQSNEAVLTVNANVSNTCDVTSQPSTLNMGYDPMNDSPSLGTSSFTYTCTNGASVYVTPYSSNYTGGSSWYTTMSGNYLYYTLWNDQSCQSNQLTQNSAEYLGGGTGSSQTYYICAIPNTGQTSVPAGTYGDTVTFTFNFG